MRAYGQDLRRRVLEAMESEQNATLVAKMFRVSKSYVSKCWIRWVNEGDNTAHQIGGGRKSILQHQMPKIHRFIKTQDDVTLNDILQYCKNELGITIKQTALWHQMNKEGLSFKKNDTRQRARQRRRAGTAQSVETKPVESGRKKARVS
jgi:Transposase and inactivated derivatives